MKGPQRLWTRLVLIFAATMTAAFAAVISVTLISANGVLRGSIDTELSDTAIAIEDRLTATSDPGQSLDELATGARFLQLVSSHGDIIARSSNLGGDRLPTMVHRHPPGSDVYQSIRFRKTDMRLIRHPLDTGGSAEGYVVVGELVSHVEGRLFSLGTILSVTALAGVAGGTLAGGWLVRREVRPLRQLAQETAATSASGFKEAVPAEGPGSEETRELRRALSALVEQQRALLERERSFFAESSHVLRTPLAVLQGDIEMLEQGVEGQERQEIVAQARRAIDTMSRTVSNLLLLSRDEKAGPASWEVLDLGTLFQSLMSDARTAFPRLTVTCSVEGPLEVAGDAAQLRAMLSSVVENACRYTVPPGSVSGIARRAAGNLAVVEISDTGVGIPPEDVSRVFERFHRGADARRLFPGGAGLGLAIARHVAGVHGGSLELEPRPGGGTIAKLTLPLLA